MKPEFGSDGCNIALLALWRLGNQPGAIPSASNENQSSLEEENARCEQVTQNSNNSLQLVPSPLYSVQYYERYPSFFHQAHFKLAAHSTSVQAVLTRGPSEAGMMEASSLAILPAATALKLPVFSSPACAVSALFPRWLSYIVSKC